MEICVKLKTEKSWYREKHEDIGILKYYVAITDLFPLVNQCSRQAIRPYTDQSASRAH